MSKGKRFLKWGLLILAILIYVSICAIPFFSLNPTVSEAEGTVTAIWTLKDTVILTLGEVIVLGILLVILVAVVVLAIKKRARFAKEIGKYESEIYTKITWYSWKDTKKSTIVVLIALVICAAVISLLDLGLAKGLIAFIQIF